MKKAAFLIMAACLLCGCNNTSSRLTESSVETTATTKATSLTIASQSVTTTAGTSANTEKTEFTSKDGYHTNLEEDQEIQDFCTFIVKKWATMYNGGASFDFTPYCKYENLAKYLAYTATHGEKPTLFSDTPSTHLAFLSFNKNGNTASGIALYSSSTGSNGNFTFLVQSVNGKLVLADMFYDAPYSIDSLYRGAQGESSGSDYWALCDYDALIKRIESGAANS